MNLWIFIFMMVVLKIPILMLFYIVWWAVKQTPDEAEQPGTGGGGSRRPPRSPGPLQRGPRRGPHNAGAPAAPLRVRPVKARGRRVPER